MTWTERRVWLLLIFIAFGYSLAIKNLNIPLDRIKLLQNLQNLSTTDYVSYLYKVDQGRGQ